MDNRLLFGDRAGERLLAVDVLLLPCCLDCRQSMPMVRHRQHDGINIAAGQQLAVIVVSLAAGVLVMTVDLVHERLQVLPVHVAGGDYLAVFQGEEGVGIAGSHDPAPDYAQGDALGGSRRAGPPQHTAGDERGESKRGPGQAQKLAAVDFCAR